MEKLEINPVHHLILRIMLGQRREENPPAPFGKLIL